MEQKLEPKFEISKADADALAAHVKNNLVWTQANAILVFMDQAFKPLTPACASLVPDAPAAGKAAKK